jgi:hypothetical protein
MNQSNRGNMLLQSIRTLGIAILKVIGLLFAWGFKIIGIGFTAISEFTFRLTEK